MCISDKCHGHFHMDTFLLNSVVSASGIYCSCVWYTLMFHLLISLTGHYFTDLLFILIITPIHLSQKCQQACKLPFLDVRALVKDMKNRNLIQEVQQDVAKTKINWWVTTVQIHETGLTTLILWHQ